MRFSMPVEPLAAYERLPGAARNIRVTNFVWTNKFCVDNDAFTFSASGRGSLNRACADA